MNPIEKKAMNARIKRKETAYKNKFGDNWKDEMKKDLKESQEKSIIAIKISRMSEEELVDYIYEIEKS